MTEPNPTHADPGDASLSQLYQQVILDHYRSPRNKGVIEDATHTITMNNPLCGDVIELLLRVKNGRIEDVSFQGKGCSISQASASMMTERIRGRSVEEARRLKERFSRMLQGATGEADASELGDLRSLSGVARFPVRVKCALLAWNCLEDLLGPEE
jgi:nitrogen fixation NifU-like protein